MELHVLGLLSNADDSIVGLKLPQNLCVERWDSTRIIHLLTSLAWQPDPDPDLRPFLTSGYHCLDESQEFGFVVVGRFSNTENESESGVLRAPAHEVLVEFTDAVNSALKVMRLFTEGAIDIPAWFFYASAEGAAPVLHSAIWSPIRPDRTPYRVRSKDALQAFLDEWPLPLEPPYVHLAFENFIESYSVYNTKLAFLLLMIALEILFNVSQQELSYRVRRGTAVALAESREDGKQILAAIRKLYDKRSKLVHTGEASVGATDVLEIRDYVRRAIITVGKMKLTKDELGKRLDEAGFGDGLSAS